MSDINRKLLEALKHALAAMKSHLGPDAPLAHVQVEWQTDPIATLQEAIAEAEQLDRNPLRTPWSLRFDRDGTEDYGIICDADGKDIAASHLPSTRIAERSFETGTFWLPEENDPVPVTVRQLRLMAAAPKLAEAIRNLLDDPDCTLDYERQVLLWAALTEATGEEPVLAA